ncbi:MAG: filamentous hemagglutinin N-terminal domain-containing protein [Nitrospira sp. BO4]|jgi:filamentous hemagglutinin family protein|nr:filamentous hemagglutinin N-terminal domain-containing protein [Nitrospira sp. BO4]
MKQLHQFHDKLVRPFVFGLSLLVTIPCHFSLAQGGTPITPSGLNTEIGAPTTLPGGGTIHDITGGTRPGNGVNLFHSFGKFNVPGDHIANFVNDSGLPTSNILGRVTGGNASNIFGTIETTGFGNANLYLMNPAGFIFGPSATLNVGGMVTVTTANTLNLADGAHFNARPSPSADSLLSSAPIVAFGFIGSNPGAITVKGSELAVAEGAGISLVGGKITVQGGTLTAPSGQINVVSVGKPSNPKVGGQVVIAGSGQETGFTPIGFRSLGTITLAQGTTLDVNEGGVTNNNAGTVLIRAGKFVMDGASIEAIHTGTGGGELGGSGGTVEVTAERVSLSNHSTLDTSTHTRGEDIALSPGRITFNVGTFTATDSSILSTSDTFTVGRGAVSIQGVLGSGTFARSISLTGTEVDTSSCCIGPNGGPILLQGDRIALNRSTLTATAGDDTGGSITLLGNSSLDIRNSRLATTSGFSLGGPVTLVAGKSINLTGTTIDASGAVRGDSITVAARNISLKSSNLISQGFGFSGSGGGGTINLMATKVVSLTKGTLLSAGGGNGVIRINGGDLFTSQQSTISANAGLGGGDATGGTIQVKAATANLTNTQLTTSTTVEQQPSVGGTITIDAKRLTLKNSQILSTALEGDGGIIDITSSILRRNAASVIDASSQTGTDGTVLINGVVQP